MLPPLVIIGRHATASAFKEYALTCNAIATSSHGAVRNPPPRHDSGAKPIAWSTPSRCPPTRSASASRCSGSVTSSSTITGSVASRRAARCVRLIARPNDVSTTSAPSSWARRATWNAIEASLSTPVTRIRLSASSILLTTSRSCRSHQSGVFEWRRAGRASRFWTRTSSASARTHRVRAGSTTASTSPRSAAR